MRWLPLGLALAFLPEAAAAAPSPPRLCDLSAAKRDALIAAVAALPTVHERVLAASERFLGVPYAESPLGEGAGPDADPLVRFDAADCQTLVETVLAIASVSAAEELGAAINAIRYDGPVDFAHRNHYFEAQWLPSNIRKGHVRDRTREVAPSEAVTHTKTVTRSQWERRRDKGRIALPPERAPLGTFTIHYVPLPRVASVARRLPSGTIFAVVRADRPAAFHMVTHMGFLVRDSKRMAVRHAGLDLYGRVVDEDLGHFIARNSRYRDWPVLGMMFLDPLERTGAALPAPAP